MPNKQEKIKSIYKKIGEIQNIGGGNGTDLIKCKRCGFEEILSRPINVQENCNFYKDINIGDVLEYCIGDKELNSHRIMGENTIFGLLNRWEYKRSPIENQSEDCIDFVFNLIK